MNEDDFEIGSCSHSELMALLDSDDIQPGSTVGYQTCKTVYLYHPLGGKMVDRPIKMAMNEPRTVHVAQSYGLEQRLRDAFEREWKAMGANQHIANAARIARIYGVSAIAMLVDNQEPNESLDYRTLYKHNVSFNILDPLNTAGSIVLNQDPNAQDFQKVDGIRVAGKPYHKSRCVVVQNEDPIYLAYNPAAFGFTGRSVYQRALYPLKSFIQTMRTDDMVAVKGGLLVTKIKGPSSVVNNMMQKLSGIKRMMLKRGKTGEVLQIGESDNIESIDLSNLEKPLDSARKHILENVAAAADMPAIIRVIENLQALVLPQGLIGVMSSGQGSLSNNTGGQRELYRGSKAALNMFMRSFAARPASVSHPMVVMAPGWIRTALGGESAPLTMAETIPSLVNVLLEKQNRPGLEYLDYRGCRVPW